MPEAALPGANEPKSPRAATTIRRLGMTTTTSLPQCPLAWKVSAGASGHARVALLPGRPLNHQLKPYLDLERGVGRLDLRQSLLDRCPLGAAAGSREDRGREHP